MENGGAGPDLLSLERIVKKDRGIFQALKKYFKKKSEHSPGFHLCRSGSTKYDNSPNRYYIIALVRGGAVRGDRFCPIHHRTSALYLKIKVKAI